MPKSHLKVAVYFNAGTGCSLIVTGVDGRAFLKANCLASEASALFEAESDFAVDVSQGFREVERTEVSQLDLGVILARRTESQIEILSDVFPDRVVD